MLGWVTITGNKSKCSVRKKLAPDWRDPGKVRVEAVGFYRCHHNPGLICRDLFMINIFLINNYFVYYGDISHEIDILSVQKF